MKKIEIHPLNVKKVGVMTTLVQEAAIRATMNKIRVRYLLIGIVLGVLLHLLWDGVASR